MVYLTKYFPKTNILIIETLTKDHEYILENNIEFLEKVILQKIVTTFSCSYN